MILVHFMFILMFSFTLKAQEAPPADSQAPAQQAPPVLTAEQIQELQQQLNKLKEAPPAEGTATEGAAAEGTAAEGEGVEPKAGRLKPPPKDVDTSMSIIEYSGKKLQPKRRNGGVGQKGIVVDSNEEAERKISERIKEPFMLPNYIYIKLKRKLGDDRGEGYVDNSVDPRQRWALKYYRLGAIIWNVKKPKAMITDKQKNLHMFYIDDLIGNGGGQITDIRNGEVVISERGSEVKLKIVNRSAEEQ